MVVLDTAIQVIAYPIFPDLVKDIPHSTFWFSMALALFRFMQLVVSPLFGYIADKYSRKIVFIFAAMGTILSFLVMLPTKAWSLFANRSIDGSTNGFYVAVRSAITDMSNRENLNSRLGILGALGAIGVVVGPLLGSLIIFSGVLGQNINPTISIIFLALILGLVNFVLSLLFKETQRKPLAQGGEEHLLSTTDNFEVGLEVTENFHYKNLIGDFVKLWKNNRTLGLLVLMEVLMVIVQGYYHYYIIYLTKIFNFGTKDINIFLLYAGFVIVSSQFIFFLVLLKKLPIKQTLVFCSVMAVILMAGYGVTRVIWLLYLLVVLDVISVSPITGLIQGQIGHLSPVHRRGRIVGMVQGFAGVVAVINPIVFGILGELNPALPFGWFAFGALLVSICAWNLPFLKMSLNYTKTLVLFKVF